MTVASGVCFVSYSRKRADEVKLIVESLRDHGVPIWQDIASLGSGQTETQLRTVLGDQNTAGAILFVTPEVEASEFIRLIESPLIFARLLRKDRFTAVVVAAGGLDCSDVGRVLGPKMGPIAPEYWNILKIKTNPISTVDADEIGQTSLNYRLAAIAGQLEPGKPVTLELSSRTDPLIKPGSHLAADLGHRFAGRTAHPGAWENHILKGFRSIRKGIQKHLPDRPLECRGPLCIPAAIALGIEFMPQSRLRAVWVQEQLKFGLGSEIWGLHVAKTASGFKAETTPGKVSGTDLALIVSVTHPPETVMDDVMATFGSDPPFRGFVHINCGDRRQLTAGEALDVAHLAVNSLGDAQKELKVRGTVHLFLAVPAGLAFMIGQLLNTVGAAQTYEHMAGRGQPYVKAALLTPSDT